MKNENLTFPVGFTPISQLSGMPPDTPFLVALSGGADSRLLFELASRHCRLYSSCFYACHVNHGIRGDEALRDRDFCVSLAKACPECRDIFVLNADVPTMAKNSGMSIEQCARHVRYDFFDQIMLEHHIPILVTAHNADDTLETVIFNLARGTGVKGLCGIPAVRPAKNGVLVRPMLGIPKSAVLELCQSERLSFVTDSTNAETEYTRNLIRAELIPILEKINPAVRESTARTCRAMTELRALTEELASEYISENGAISLSKLRTANPSLHPYVFSLAAERIGSELEAVHVDALRSICRTAKDGASLSLPNRCRAVIIGDSLLIEKDRDGYAPPPFDLPLTEGITVLPLWRIEASVTENSLSVSLTFNPNKKIPKKI